MSAGKKRQTMAKQARERAVREKRALKLERKRGGYVAEGEDVHAHESEPGLHLVTENGAGPAPAAADADPEPGTPEGEASADGPDA
jgi:hypothetical protein